MERKQWLIATQLSVLEALVIKIDENIHPWLLQHTCTVDSVQPTVYTCTVDSRHIVDIVNLIHKIETQGKIIYDKSDTPG